VHYAAQGIEHYITAYMQSITGMHFEEKTLAVHSLFPKALNSSTCGCFSILDYRRGFRKSL